ncbi:MAG TPA: AMP-binding protein [Terriglobales bacterium]|nr:AMP-binding protein [Terriglobales bacterium]
MLLPTHSAFLRHQATRCGERGGLIWRDAPYSFTAVAAASERIAGWLARCGIGRNDSVLIVMGNQPALIAAFYGCWSIGATVVPANARSTAGEIEAMAGHARARMVLCDAERAEVVREAARAAPIAAGCIPGDLTAGPKLTVRGRARTSREPRLPGSEDLAVLTFTSGTTSKPKGVMLTHANLLWSALACATARGDSPDGVGLCLSPLSHTPVFVSHLLCRLLLGQSAVLFDKVEADAVLAAIERHRVTDLPLIAGMVLSFLELGRIAERRRRSLRKVSIGGAPTTMAAKRQLAELFAGAEIIEAYGQSESTDGVCMTRGREAIERPGTIGRANPYVSVRIRRADRTFAAAGEQGEIVIGGPTVMRGYYRDHAATTAQLRQGWLHTGDLGRADEEGFFYITGRLKDLIISGGENIAPAEVEEVLRRHPDIADVAVIGTPHPRWGEQVTAVVVPRPGANLTGAGIRDFAAEHLAAFKKPRRVEIVDSLPRNATNKVQTGMLKQMFGKDS